METKEYNYYVKRWKKYWKREEEYYTKRAEYVREDKDYLIPALDKRYGHGSIDSPYQFGPFTIIRDQADLLNPNFILPGYDYPFCQHPNTDHNIPLYFGKILSSELEKCEGEVIGYAYDAYDDYIQIRLDTGEIRNIMVNSHYKVEE
jgi:hypothetical protein